MNMNDYDSCAAETAIYKHSGTGNIEAISYLGHGLAGEAGEVNDEIKKAMRDDDYELTADRYDKILHELGDNLWYISRMAKELGSSLDEIAFMNIKKLNTRYSGRR